MGSCPLILALVAALALIGTPARADDGDKLAAKTSFERGEKAYAAGEYRAAASHYLRAYNHLPRPKLLYNAAQAYRLAGMRDAAIAQFRRYLAAEPDGKTSAIARQHLERLLAERKPDGTIAVEPAKPAPALDREQPNRGRRIAGHLSVAVAVAGAAGGVALAVHARSLNSDVEDHRQGPWTAELLDKRESAETARRNAIIVGAASGLAAATAVLLYWSSSTSRSEGSIAISPLLERDGAGAAVRVSF